MVDLYKVKQIKNSLVFHGSARVDKFDLEELADYAEKALEGDEGISQNASSAFDYAEDIESRIDDILEEIEDCNAAILTNEDLPESFKAWFTGSLEKLEKLSKDILSDADDIKTCACNIQDKNRGIE